LQEGLVVVLQELWMEHVLVGKDLECLGLLQDQTGLRQTNELINQKIVLKEERPIARELQQEGITQVLYTLNLFLI
jgi:hypothetical protein